MTRIAYRLVPKAGGGFHLGREGLDQEASAESFPSDSLFAALMATLRSVDADRFEDFIARWIATPAPAGPPFRISSLFPTAGGLPLLPIPRLRVNLGSAPRPGVAKTLKRIAYVSPAILERLLSGAAMDRWLPESGQPGEGLLLQDGKVWISREERSALPPAWQSLDGARLHDAAIWKAQPVPRVTVDRVTNRGSIFHVGRTVFAEGCGLWLLADVQHEGELLDMLLHILADQGIGGERNAGYGAFTLDAFSPPTLPSAERAARVMTLARYNPAPDEWEAGVLGPNASYELVDVGGWLAAPGVRAQRRKRVRMIEVGSILAAPVPVIGRIVDVCPEYDLPGAPSHPVYRSGIALPIGVPGGTDG